MNFAWTDAQGNVVVGHHARVTLRNAGKHQPWLHIRKVRPIHVLDQPRPEIKRRPAPFGIHKQSARQLGKGRSLKRLKPASCVRSETVSAARKRGFAAKMAEGRFPGGGGMLGRWTPRGRQPKTGRLVISIL